MTEENGKGVEDQINQLYSANSQAKLDLMSSPENGEQQNQDHTKSALTVPRHGASNTPLDLNELENDHQELRMSSAKKGRNQEAGVITADPPDKEMDFDIGKQGEGETGGPTPEPRGEELEPKNLTE